MTRRRGGGRAKLDPAVAQAVAEVGIDTSGAGRHHPLAVEAARRSGVNIEAVAQWTPKTAKRFTRAYESVGEDCQRQIRIRDRVAAALAEHGVDAPDQLPREVLADAYETTVEALAATSATLDALLPSRWWEMPMPAGGV